MTTESGCGHPALDRHRRVVLESTHWEKTCDPPSCFKSPLLPCCVGLPLGPKAWARPLPGNARDVRGKLVRQRRTQMATSIARVSRTEAPVP